MDVSMGNAPSAFGSTSSAGKNKSKASKKKKRAQKSQDLMADEDGFVAPGPASEGQKNPQLHADAMPLAPGVARRGMPVFARYGSLMGCAGCVRNKGDG